MVRFTIPQAVTALLAAVQTVSSTPFTVGGLDQRSASPSNSSVWPSALNGQVYGESWPEFSNKTKRWSSYRAPTFDEVFLPENENDLSLGVSYFAPVLSIEG